MKKALSLILAPVLCFALAASVLADDPIRVTVNGKAVEWTDAQPFIDENNRTMVPLRAVATALGLKVVWYAAEREAAFTDGGKVIYFPIGGSTASAFGSEDVTMDTAAVIANDRTYAPARYLAEFFGYDVEWDGATRTVIITKGQGADFVCGETEPHQWKDANYQAPETCAVCGATQGEALTPDFVTYEIKADLEIGKHYNYETATYENPDLTTVGDLTVLDYSIIRSDDTHEAKDGYEWRMATLQMVFSDENAHTYGYQPGTSLENFYDVRMNDGSVVYDDDGNATFTVNYYGEDMECFCRQDIPINAWQEDDTAKVVAIVSFQVPVGYDGCVFGMRNYAVEWPDGAYIFDFYDPDVFYLFHFI